MQRDGAQHQGPGDLMPGEDNGAADGSVDLRGVVPWTTCMFAAGLWIGCAAAGGSPWSGVDWASCADTMTGACLGSSAACAAGAAVLALRGWSRGGFTRVDGWVGLVLVALSAVALGAGLRFEETVASARRPRLSIPDEGQLARIEARVVAPFVERGFAVDLLAKYLVRPTRFVGLVSDVAFIDEAGVKREISDRDALLSVSVLDAPPACGVADRVSFVGTIRHIDAARLPGDARMKEHAARRGVIGSVAVESPALVRVVPDADASEPIADAFARLRDAARMRVRAALLEGVPDDEAVAIRSMLVALVLGDAEDGYRTIENSFRAVGLSHILAISGFNLAVLGWVVGLAARLISSDERVHAVACGIAALGALVLMAPAASAVRSALMAVVGASGGAMGREWNGDAVLAIAAIAMLVVAPSDALNPGFQLSFACVLALRHLSQPIARLWLAWMPSDDPRRGHPAWLGVAGEFLSRMVASGLAAFMASTPIVLVHFGSLQPFGTLLTLLSAPLSTATLAIAYPKAVLGAVWPPLLAFLAWPMWLMAWLQVELVELAVRFGGGSVALGSFHWLVGMTLAAVGFVALRAPRRSARGVAWLAAIMLLLSGGNIGRSAETRPHFECTMFAIGDGTAVAIESGESIVLFDGGSSSIGNVASRALLPWIDARGGSVDAVFISHPDLDHLSALADVVRYASVRRVVVHDSMLAAERVNPAIAELLGAMRTGGVEIEVVSTGDTLRIGNAQWSVLWPSKDFGSKRDNDMSLVMSIEVDAPSGVQAPRMLFSGDIETEPAARLAAMHARREVDLRCDVLEIPHHGSWREAVVGYIAAAEPAFVLQSTARRRFAQDRFGPHLDPEARRLVTCRDGTIRISIGADGSIEVFVIDESAERGMRPAGRAAGRRPRRLRVRWQRSGLADEAPAADDHAVAGDSVAAVVDDDLERAVLGESMQHSDSRATVCGVKNQSIARRALESHGHRGAGIERNRLDERDLGAECDGATRGDKRGGKSEARLDRAVELDRSKPEQRLVGRIDSYLRSCLIAIRRIGRAALRRAACSQWRQRRAVEEDGARPRHRNLDRLRLLTRAKIGIREEESPTRVRLEGDVLRAHDAAVGRPDERVRRGGLPERCEGDRGDAVRLDPPRGRSRCWLRSVASAFGLCRLLGRRWFVACGLEKDLVADRLDEAGGDIAIQEEHGVGVCPRGRAACRDEAQLGQDIGLDRDRADPTMLPLRRTRVGPERARKELPVAEHERPAAQLGEELHRPALIGTDEARDDGRSLDVDGLRLHTCIRTRQYAFGGVHRLDATVDPCSVSQQQLNTGGIGRRGGRRHRLRLTERRKTKRRGKRDRGGEEWSCARVFHGCRRRYRVCLALEDRKVSLRHLKHDQRHRGAIRIALRIRPRAIWILLRKELVADRRPPGAPAFPAREIHRLDRVVVAVEVVRLREASCKSTAAARKCVLLEVVKAAFDRLILVDARVEEARYARSRAWPRRAAKILHVAEASVGVLAGSHVADGVVDRGLRHLDAGVPCAPKRHDLADGHGHIRVVGYRVVAPATLVVLAADDQLHRANQRVADAIVLLVHAVDLAKEQGRESVAVHRTVRLIGDKKARLGRVIENKIECLLHALPELTAARKVSVRHQRDRTKARNADMLAEPALAKRPVGLLLAPQVLEALANRLLEAGIDLGLGRRILRSKVVGTSSARRARSSRLHWVRGHWRRSSVRGGGLVRQPKSGRRSSGAARHSGREHVADWLILILIVRRKSSRKHRQLVRTRDQHDRPATVDRCELRPCGFRTDRFTRGPPNIRGWRRDDRSVDLGKKAQAEYGDGRGGMHHFEASSARRR